MDAGDDQRSEAGGGLAGPSHFAFSTRGLPAKTRFDAWRETVAQLAGVEVSTTAPQGFEGEFTARAAGPVGLFSSTTKQTRYARTRSLAGNGDDNFSLTLCGDGFAVATSQAEFSRIDAGSSFFLAHDRPFAVTSADDACCFIMQIDRQALLTLLPPGTDFGMTGFAGGNSILELIRSYVPALMTKTEPPSAQASEMMGRHVVDLVALLLRPSREAAEMIEGRGLKAARTKAVLDAIGRDYARPDLSAEMIGRKLGISARQVHRLLEETPKTFYEQLVESRLQRAWQLLADPAGPAIPIAEVAHSAGFHNLSQFNRSFRARFGDTPTGTRANAARAETLRFLRHARVIPA